MLKTLRSKLIVTYAVVVILCLLLTAAAAVYLFNSYQAHVARRNMRLLVIALAGPVENIALGRVPWREATRRLEQRAREVGVRLLLLDGEGHVRMDTAGQANGRFWLPISEAINTAPLRQPIERFTDPSGRAYYYAVTPLYRSENAPLDMPHYVAFALPVREVDVAWQELAPPLLSIGGAVFVLATLLGVVLARSVSQPIREITRATEAMARGEYAQEIDVTGDDEVTRLARSFNAMAHEVNRAHQMQRDFVANVSHDLKTPLTSIQGFAQALLDGTAESPEARQRAARVIYEETERMRRLVQTLLELAKLESGQIEMAKEPVNLGPVLSEAVDRVLPLAEARQVSVNLRAPASLPLVRGDEARLAQVFNNLLDNAVTHTPAGGTIEVSAAPTSEGTLEIVVSDTGHGIPTPDLPRVFERFYQADKARAGGAGTGLGLAIVQEVISAHGGRVHAASQPGQGTRFTIVLPIDRG